MKSKMSIGDAPPPFSARRKLNFDEPNESDNLEGHLANLRGLKGYSKIADELNKYIDKREDYLKHHQGEKIFISEVGTFLEKEKQNKKIDFNGPFLVMTIGAECVR